MHNRLIKNHFVASSFVSGEDSRTSRPHFEPYWAGDSGPSQATVPIRVFTQVLLVIVFSIVERLRICDFCGNLTKTALSQYLKDTTFTDLGGKLSHRRTSCQGLELRSNEKRLRMEMPGWVVPTNTESVGDHTFSSL